MDQIAFDFETTANVLWMEFLSEYEHAKDVFYNDWIEFIANYYSIDEYYFYDNVELLDEIKSYYERLNSL